MDKLVAIRTDGASAAKVGPANGLSPADLEAGGARAEQALRAMLEARDAGKAGFLDLPLHGDPVDACLGEAETIRGRCDTLVVSGMGGSALGARALITAL